MSFTCSPSAVNSFQSLIGNLFIGCLLSPLVYLLISIAVILFLWGVFKFVSSEGDEREAGKQFIFWGLIGVFVIVSLWGIVSILQGTFGDLDSQNITPNQVTIPQL